MTTQEPVYGNEDPFGDDFVFPYEEELKERARICLEHNQDALRHFVEVLAWETFDNPVLRKYLVPIFWLLKNIDRRWIAEAYCMTVHDVCNIVEGNCIYSFNCLDCGREVQAKDRQHLSIMSNSLQAVSEDSIVDSGHLNNLLCHRCKGDRDRDEEKQRKLDHARQQALIAEYRKVPYAERRKSGEWSVLKRQIFRRDGYRCKLCGRDDLPLHLHHNNYSNYATEKLEDLIALCELCHERHHRLEDGS